ncbi:AAA family ATPase [Acidiphilium acidophilum]|uniref:AAA family ATPase n=1 Tax=Acidiphilium acidophilum TaxID=76588 RepID=A0AAW9DKM2_ACIAO|nr:AAA family ATPase [Acidiphilium acidophilum]MDX5929515.1 AAA family ATPase [Acidiphilium acidophilum]GBR77118.1 putative kinase [Acidiphilium acidophilum DSM 700]
MLIAFGGLPGTGKTTIAQALARRVGAIYLRIDVIEQAIRDAGVLAGDIGPAGYQVANALATSNLALGHIVVADSVNPVAESRAGWGAVAASVSARLVEVEVVCSDATEHRRRVEERPSDIPGLSPPTWQSVATHHFEPWSDPHFSIDTACLTAEEAVMAIEAHISRIIIQAG